MLDCVQISRNVQWVWMIATNLLFAKIRWEVFSANVSWAFKEMAEYALVNPSHSFMFRVYSDHKYVVIVVLSDVDECLTNRDDCSSNAVCTNTEGSFDCSCGAGFEGSGTSCEGII